MWSLGVIAFVLLSGYMPFSGSEAVQTRNISTGHYVLKPERWTPISLEGRQFVKAMLEVDPAKRLTAGQALQHPWIAQRHADMDLDKGVVEALRTFAHSSKFRRCCLEMMAWSLSNDDRAQVRKEFLALDKSQQGTIKLRDLKQVLEEKLHISNEETMEIFDALDTNHDEEIHYSDFLAAMVSTRISVHDHLLQATFKKFDVDSSGYITVDNLRDVLGDTFEGEQVEKLLAEADLLKDNRISFDEFKQFVRGDKMDMATKVIDQEIQYIHQRERQRSKESTAGGSEIFKGNSGIIKGNSALNVMPKHAAAVVMPPEKPPIKKDEVTMTQSTVATGDPAGAQQSNPVARHISDSIVKQELCCVVS